MPKRKNATKNRTLIILTSIIALSVIIGFIFLRGFLESRGIQNVKTDQREQKVENPPEADSFELASDQTLGSGFAVKYPDGWTNVHTGAPQPQSQSEPQTDQNTITSPSGKIQVVLKVDTLAQIGGLCGDGYITLKYLNADTDPLPSYNEGRFVAYVVYFPDFNLYQYHVGLQKNTEAIRQVTLENSMACNFMFSEFIQRDSLLPNVPKTTTTLNITFPDLVSKGQDLKAGIGEAEVAARLSGVEYEQAKAIVRSLYIK